MGLNPTGSEIPRSLTQIGTTIDAALNGKADFVRLAANPSNVNVVSSYEVTGELDDASISISTPVTLTNQGTDVWESGTDGLSVDSGYWLLEIDTGSWISNEDTLTAPENCTWTPQGNAAGTPVLAFSPAITKTPGQFALVNNSVLWENLGTDASPNWKVASGKADFVRLTVNPGVSTVVSRYQVGGSLAYDGTPVANGPDYLFFVSANLWQNDNANEIGTTSSLSVSSNKWQLNYGTGPGGTWLSVQTIATRPENCTWEAASLEFGDPVLTFTPATVATTGQFALVDDTVNPPVMWQNLGDDTTPDWVPLTTATALSAHTTATGNVHGLSGANVRSILGVSTLSGSNTGDQNLAPYAPLASPALTGDPTAPTQAAGNNSTRIATTAFVAASFATTSAVAATYETKARTGVISGTFGFETYFNGGAAPTGLDITKVYYEAQKSWYWDTVNEVWVSVFIEDVGLKTWNVFSGLSQLLDTTVGNLNYVSATTSQSFDDPYKAQARTNISAAGAGYTTTATAAGTLTLTATSNTQQFFTGSTTHTVVLPVASTMTLGNYVVLENNSSGNVTVNSSGMNTVVSLIAGASVKITCILTSGTGVASWDVEYVGSSTELATTSAVAAGYQPLDADLTAIAALETTSTGRSLLTESTAQTGTGALVRAASPTLTGDPTAPTQTAGNDSTRIATTAFVAAGFVPRITSVDNQLVRFDGTTGAAQGSGITVDDSDNVTGVVGLTASGTVAIGASAKFTEQTYTPTGTTQTIDLNSGNLNTLSLGSTTGDVTLTLTVPASAASGRIKIIQHGTTARGITIALSAGTAVWYSAIPAFSSQAISKKTMLSYTWDGTDMSLQAAEAI